jgi:hypothetical protein
MQRTASARSAKTKDGRPRRERDRSRRSKGNREHTPVRRRAARRFHMSTDLATATGRVAMETPCGPLLPLAVTGPTTTLPRAIDLERIGHRFSAAVVPGRSGGGRQRGAACSRERIDEMRSRGRRGGSRTRHDGERRRRGSSFPFRSGHDVEPGRWPGRSRPPAARSRSTRRCIGRRARERARGGGVLGATRSRDVGAVFISA